MIANTVSGTGNKSLTGSELYSLIDQDTTSSGVQLTNSDVLYLDVDLGHRIKVDSIELYASDLTKSTNIIFSYKNENLDTYTEISETVSATTYMATIPYPSAPRYIRCTISGIDINLYEFKVLNNDFIIEFGDDGSETDVWLDDTPIGIEGTPKSIKIYNNSSSDKASTAYVCVDYTGNGKDNYIKISNTLGGIYEGFEDGAILGYKYHDWDTGFYSNTYKESDNTIRLSNTGYNYIRKHKIGYMPVQDIYTGYGQPFGFLDAWDYDSINNKIYAMFWVGTSNTVGTLKLYEYDVDTNIWTYLSTFTETSPYAIRMCMCYHLGYIYFMMESGGQFKRHDLFGAQDNVEDLTTYPSTSYHYRTLISADSNTIYYFNSFESDSQIYQYFYRYTIDTNSWVARDTPDFQNANRYTRLAYDDIRQVIYKFNYNSVNGWVQKYDISGDIWYENYFNFDSRITADPGYIDIWYYNNKIYFCGSNLSYVYTYDVTTDIINTIDTDLTWTGFHPGLIVMSPTINATASGVNDVSIFAVDILNDRKSLYGYNTGVEYTEQLSDFQSGTYTSSIITVDESYKSSYFIINADTETNKSSVSTDDTLYNGTIEVRSSDTKPTTINEVYWPYYLYQSPTNPYYYMTFIGKYIVGTDAFDYDWKYLTGSNVSTVYYGFSSAVDRRTGNIFSGYHRYASGSNGDDIFFRVYNRSGTEIGNYDWTNTGYDYLSSSKQPYFDGSSYVWFYMDQMTTLYHRNHDLTSSLGSRSVPSLYQLAAQLNGSGCWYTERVNMTLVKLFYNCNIDFTINLESPFGVCSTEDNGCWVSDYGDLTYGNCIKRYDVDGNLIKVITLDKPLYNLAHDHNDGFYARTATTDGEIRHYTSTGIMDMKVVELEGVVYISGGVDGCLVYNSSTRVAYYIDKSTASIIWTKNYDQDIWSSGVKQASIPALFSFDLNLQDQFEDDSGKLLPVSYDTMWYGDNNLEWQEVPKDGYFLPKHKYHQVRTTLRSLDGTSTPIMRSISMAPALKVNDIYPQSSKPIYVRSDIPVNSSVSQFDTRLKVWWDVEE